MSTICSCCGAERAPDDTGEAWLRIRWPLTDDATNVCPSCRLAWEDEHLIQQAKGRKP